MSDRDRLLFAAAAIGVITCALIWSVIGVGLLTRDPERAAADHEIHRQTQRAEHETDASVLALADEACADSRTTGADESQQHDKRDLCAQYVAAAAARKAANYAQAQTWIGVVGFGFVVVGLWLNWVATVAATEANRQAREQFEAERRAWVRVTGDISHIFGERGKTGRILFVVQTENIGLSPALDITATTPPPEEIWDDEQIAELRRQIDAARTGPPPEPGGTLFPNEDGVHYQNVQVALPPPVWEDTPFMAYVYGWVSYRLKPGGELHFTPFNFNILYWWSEAEEEWKWSEPERRPVSVDPD